MSCMLIVQCVVVLTLHQTSYGQDVPSFRDYKYLEETLSFYKLHTTRLSWQAAVNTCTSEEATLFYPSNKCEVNAVLKTWSETPTIGWIFIGISSKIEGVFETVDGKQIWDVYSKWRPGEPNNANGEENCVVLLRDGTLNDMHCGKTFPFICIKKKDLNQTEALCYKAEKNEEPVLKFRKDFTYLQETHSFYKIHTIAHNWRDANDICKREEATLFYPKNKCEAEVVLDFWNQTQPFNRVFVGISSSTTGSFKTIDEVPVWEVYNKWRPGEPNNANGNENCVVLIRDGMYNDVQCGLSLPFICKKTINSSNNNGICIETETAAIDLPGTNFRKDYTFIEDTKSYYKIHTILRRWQDAKETCAAEGASLFYPENECENNAVLDFWHQTQPFGWAYIGVVNPTREATVLNFETIDGRPVWKVYNNWRRGEPNNVNGEENCVVLLREGTLNDDRCDKNYAFICKKEISLQKDNAFCFKLEDAKKFRKDYTYLENTQSFYKIHSDFQSWRIANETCEYEGAVLYYPENKCEANLVLEFWKQRQTFQRIYIGIISTKRSIFETVDGYPAWKMYSNWRPTEPNNDHEEEGCVVFHRNGALLSDENCEKKYPFLCKRKVNPRKSNFGCDAPEIGKKSIVNFRNDYTYLEKTQSFYKIHTIYNNWPDAKIMCDNEGASLYYPVNSCEFNVVLEFWNNNLPYTIDWSYIGILKKNKAFESIDGHQEKDLFIKWEPNQPNYNDTNGEDCVVFNRFTTLFSSTKCDMKKWFICKKKMNFGKKYAFCDASETNRSDYKYLNDTMSYYKYHASERTWQDAVKVCAEEDASLFFPINKCEADAVIDYWNKIEPFRWIYIGISVSTDGTFMTLDSKSIWDVYNNWRPGEPNKENGDENCVVLLQDGTLNDVECGKTFPFMCKRKLNSGSEEALCNKSENKKPLAKFRKDYTYLEDNRSFYKIHTIPHNWQGAKEICTSEGATLFYPENKCEANVVLEFWNQTQPFPRIFIGVTSPDKGTFETVDGRAVWEVYNNWQPGEPNNANGNEDCVVLSRDGTLNDENCNLNITFICKKRIREEIAVCDKPETDSKLEIFRKDYTYLEDTKSFYKIHTIFRNWQDAKDTCVKEATSLFFPENEHEANVVLDFLKQTQPFNWVYIGVLNPTKEKVPAVTHFQTINGRPVKDVYNRWHDGEPNNAHGEEYCVTLSKDGTFNDDQCFKNYAFICKKTLEPVLPINNDSETNDEPNIPFREDYTYLEETQSFYKIHTTFRDWENARRVCFEEGATLFYPENKCESDVVLNFWSQKQFFHRIFIGIFSQIRGIFVTVDGSPAWKMYSKWRPGEPNNENEVEGCVVFHRQEAMLSDESCNKKYPFICRKQKSKRKNNIGCNKPETDAKSVPNFRNDYIYLEKVKSFYKIHTIYNKWQEAKLMCEYEGASLFYPENAVESDVVLDYWNNALPYTIDWSHLGILTAKDKTIKTFDGHQEADLFLNWEPNEPNNDNEKENYCVVVNRFSRMISDRPCSESKTAFICRKKMYSGKNDVTCDTPAMGYTYSAVQAKCYKFHLTPMNWTGANEMCRAEQSYLAVINNKAEADYLVKITGQAAKDQVTGNFLAGAVHLGFRKIDGSGWKNIHGQPLQQAGYSRWSYNQPDGGDKELCGSMFYNGELNDIGCLQKCFFICEHDVNFNS